MYYTCLRVQCDSEFADILMAEIAEAGFDSFMETEKGFEAYAEGEQFDRQQLQSIWEKYASQSSFTFSFDKVEKRNWNEEWEKNYEPVIVEGKCRIRAFFHAPDPSFPYEIIITPKMSFGTGHHPTTYLMIKSQLEIDHKEKRVMDAGCGTAILSIMASKSGASEVVAFDIDEWSVINGKENIEINACPNIHIHQGTIVEVSPEGKFDIVLANINKSVLLKEVPVYRQYLQPGGLLLLSGFFEADIDDLLREVSPCGLRKIKQYSREAWAALLMQAV